MNNVDDKINEKIIKANQKAVKDLPKLSAVVDAVQGKVPMSAVLGKDFLTEGIPKEHLFTLQQGEQINDINQKIVKALGLVMVTTAHKHAISNQPDSEPMQAIKGLGDAVHELLELVDPTVDLEAGRDSERSEREGATLAISPDTVPDPHLSQDDGGVYSE